MAYISQGKNKDTRAERPFLFDDCVLCIAKHIYNMIYD